MKSEIREALGKAAYDAKIKILDAQGHIQHGEFGTFLEQWEQFDEETREIYRYQAEGVVIRLAEMLLPATLWLLLSEDEMKRLLKEALAGD